MERENGIVVRAAFDREMISERGKSTRYLVVDLEAPHSSLAPGDKPALNLALAIDVSASMSGKRLMAAQEAALGVVHCLSESDRLSLVSFATDMYVHFDGLKLDKAGKLKAIEAIEKLSPRDNTNLGGGWMKAAECAAKVMHRKSDMHNHVIILSDGFANIGMTNPIILEHHADQLRQRGILTSCVGVGNDYSSTQLQALSTFGGGRLHDAEHPGEIIECVLGELRELQSTIVEDVSVLLTFPANCRVENLSGFPTVASNSSVLCQMGSLAPLSMRCVVFRINCPEGVDGEKLPFQVTCNWLWTGTTKRDSKKSSMLVLTMVPGTINMHQPRNKSLCLRVAEIWQSNIVRRAVKLNRDKKLQELCKFLDYEMRYFVRYCDGLPGAEPLLMALDNMRNVADREWDERSRKSMEYDTYLTQTNLMDHRSLERAGWWKYLEDRAASDRR